MRDDITDGLAIRRRTAMWRWVLSVVVAAVLLAVLVVLVVRLDTTRSTRDVAAVVVAAVLAAGAVGVTWLESRRITGQLHRAIDRLIDAESELRLDEGPLGEEEARRRLAGWWETQQVKQ